MYNLYLLFFIYMRCSAGPSVPRLPGYPPSSKLAQCRKCAQSARCEPGLGRGRPIGSAAAKCEQNPTQSQIERLVL